MKNLLKNMSIYYRLADFIWDGGKTKYEELQNKSLLNLKNKI
jgi:hypothetical protein